MGAGDGPPAPPDAQRADASVSNGDDACRIAFTGPLLIGAVDRLRGKLGKVPQDRPIVVDLSAVEALDTAGAWLVASLAPPSRMTVVGAQAPHLRLLGAVRDGMGRPRRESAARPATGPAARLDRLGRRTIVAASGFAEVLGFLGLTLSRMFRLLARPWRLRLTPLVHHMQATGLEAIPIVALMAFLIGVVLAFQGAAQLQQFGAEVFVVELIAISVLRELGILLTAIIVAGRTGAAFTSAIGSMKMREEIDAMRTLGLDPIEVLVVPRVLALVLTLPILGFIADIAGLFGGALMSWIELGVSPAAFQTRLNETVGVGNYVVGLVKAPVFALIIGIVGCHHGFSVGGNAESLGRLTSRSVVVSIFAVIVADALFSIFFSLVGV